VSPARQEVEVRVGSRTLVLSNLDKVLYPEAGFRKGQAIDYYRRIAPFLLPHLRDRPLTLKRYPDGVRGEFFFEKNCSASRPEWVATAEVWSEGNQRWMRYCLANDLPSLVWMANLAALELHPQLHRWQAQQRPTVVAFDLDPGLPAGLLQCCHVALRVRALCDRLGLRCFPKTSGGKGLQVYVPLNTPVTYDATKAWARAVAELLERQTPREVVSRMRKDLRQGKVFVDWSQNDEHKTTVAAYSLRARERPTVSMPLRWDEVEHAADEEDASGLVFEAEPAIARAERLGDLFAPVLTLHQRLPALAHRAPA
jgi:bifunctional non-homologous end joining protein LigD